MRCCVCRECDAIVSLENGSLEIDELPLDSQELIHWACSLCGRSQPPADWWPVFLGWPVDSPVTTLIKAGASETVEHFGETVEFDKPSGTLF